MNNHHAYTIPCGLLLTTIGCITRYHIDRCRFNRRGIGGLQHFSSYGKAVCITAIENLTRFVGTLCLLAGLFLLAIAGFDHLNR
jgi:hypothetical protein